MIAVWLVGPPFSVTSATTVAGVEAGGVGGREVLGDQHRGLVGHRDAGLGLADQPGGHPALDVAQVGDPLGHQAAHRGEDAGELLDGGVQRGQQRVAGREPLLHRRPQPLVAGQPGGGGEHLGGGAAGAVGPGGQPLGGGGDRDVVRREGRSASGKPAGLEGRDGGRGHRDGGDHDRGVGDAGDDRGAAKGGVAIGHVPTISGAPLDSQQIRA